jgi:DNA-binding transcriptional MerR regulator
MGKMSLEEKVDLIRWEADKQLLPDPDPMPYSYIFAVYDKYVIVYKDGKFYKHTYEIDGEEVKFGDGVEVEQDTKWREVKGLIKFMGFPMLKAVGDWELDVLAVPFGDESNKDADGEYFANDTNFYLENYKPPAFYYHGYDPNGMPMGEPALIGKTESAEVKKDGVWLRVVLDKASEFAQRVWDAAKNGLARASSGSITHLVRKDEDGHILTWPLAEISLFDIDGNRQPANQYAVAVPVMKSNYSKAGLDMPEWAEDEAKGASKEPNQDSDSVEEKAKKEKDKTMSDEKTGLTLEQLTEILDAREAKKAEEAKKAKELQDRIDKEVADKVKEKEEEMKKEFAKSGRLPYDEAPTVAKFSEVWKYDSVDDGALAMGIDILNTGAAKGKKGAYKASEGMYKALALRLEGKKESDPAKRSFKMLERAHGKALKSDEIMYSTLSSYGDEWVGVEYSRNLWESIRIGTPILAKLPQQEIPQGYESDVIPLESTDPTWYKVAQAADHTSGRPDVTVTASQAGTANQSLTLSKLGARVTWSGELAEDSLIPILPQIREQMIVSGMEQLENAIINGDNATASVTNINDIAGTPAGSEVFMVWDGFRVLPLVTNTANSRDGGSLTVEDYIETMRKMGTAGINALDIEKCAFIIGPQEYYATMKLEEVKTRDVFAAPTIENGRLTGLWGYPIYVSAQMCAGSADRLSNSDGKIDLDTTSNNTKGSILAVRFDQWKFAWKRRMTLETDRWPESDTNQLVAMFRCGMAYRDNEASAISYNLTV